MSRPVHGSFAVTAGRDEDADFSSHHRPAPWLTLSCPSRKLGSQHRLSLCPCSPSPLQSVQGEVRGVLPQPHWVTQPAENTSTWLPKCPTVSLRMGSKNWPFPNSSGNSNAHLSLETTPPAVFASVPVWGVLFLSRTFSYSFLNSPILSDHYPTFTFSFKCLLWCLDQIRFLWNRLHGTCYYILTVFSFWTANLSLTL